MKNLDIAHIIKVYEIDEHELAKVMFPDNKHPMAALTRVLNGLMKLDTDQLERLAAYVGLSVGDLYTTDGWKSTYTTKCMTFTNDDLVVKINCGGSFASVFRDGNLLEQFIVNGAMRLSDVINELNLLTLKYKQNGKSTKN